MYSSTMMLSWGLFQEGCKAVCRGANQTLCVAKRQQAGWNERRLFKVHDKKRHSNIKAIS